MNLKNRTLTTIISHGETHDGKPFNFFNDVAVGENDTVYFTDSSWKWTRRDSRYAVLEATGRGRLVSFNTRSKEIQTLLDELQIPNGLEIEREMGFLLVGETTASKITK